MSEASKAHSRSATETTKQTSRILGWLIPLVVALAISFLLSPFVAAWLNAPLPAWQPLRSWAQLVQRTTGLASPTDIAGREPNAAEASEPSIADSSPDGNWPAPPDGFMASSGYISDTVSTADVAVPTATPGPTPTRFALPTPSWEEMNYLTSVKFNASTIVEAERETTLAIIGNITTDRLLLKVVGDVLVGIDLSKVADVEVDGRAIRLSVPEPEVMAVEILPDKSQIFDSSRTLFLSQYDGLETDALEQARQQLRIEVSENDGLMKLATEMSRLQLTEFLETLGYRKIDLDFPYLDVENKESN